ncbi:MAG TPA: elongation factor G [Firmicutes bacterium]|nr:elongation factor G [Bacillota bacterium]
MGKYKTEQLRNVALVAHGGAGKTSLAEAILYNSGAVERLGKVDDGTATTDYDPEEIKRKISINTAIAPCEWSGNKINIIDTPGFADFVGEVKSGLRVADAAVVVFCAVSGVEVGSENVWSFADERGLPRIAFINKMDRENADFYKVVDAIRSQFGQHVVPVQIPIGSQESFEGVVDLISMKAILPDAGGRKIKTADIPADLQDRAKSYRDMMLEVAAENDDELIEKYLDGQELTEDEIRRGLAKGVKAGKAVPIFCGSSLRNIGIQPLMDALVSYLPFPGELGGVEGVNPVSKQRETRELKAGQPFSAFVFKTMADPYVGKLTFFKVYSGTINSDSQAYNANKDRQERIGQIFFMRGKQQEPTQEVIAGDIAAVAKLQETSTGETLCDKEHPIIFDGIAFPEPALSMAVEPKSKGDEDKISAGLARLAEEDPTFKVKKDAETGQTIISGMGEQHLEVIADRLKRKFGVEVTLDTPRVPYRETIRGSVKVEGKHKKQTGGRGQYGHVWLELEPLPPGGDFEFVDKIFGGAVPRQYIPAVEKGVREALAEGVLAGYPLVDLRVTLYDGSYHPVDSSEMAFKIAASMALKKGAMDAKPVLLEPIMNVEVVVPEAYMGDIMGDLNKRRGKILGMEPSGKNQVIKALVPMAEMFKYAIDLRSITGGRGHYSMSFDHYEEVPAQISQQIIEAAAREREKEK